MLDDIFSRIFGDEDDEETGENELDEFYSVDGSAPSFLDNDMPGYDMETEKTLDPNTGIDDYVINEEPHLKEFEPDPASYATMNTAETMKMGGGTAQDDGIEPVAGTGMDEDWERRPTITELEEQFYDDVIQDIRDRITEERLWEAAAAVTGEDQATVEAAVAETVTDPARLVDQARQHAIETAETLYLRDEKYREDIDDLVEEALRDNVTDVVPTYPLRDGVEKLYDGDEIDPRAIQRHLVRQLATDAGELSDVDEVGTRLAAGDRIMPEDSPEAVEAALPGALDRIESRVGETTMGVAYRSGHPAVQDAAADRLQDSIGKELQRAATGGGALPQETLEKLQQQYRNTLERFRVDATLETMDELWGTADMPYEVFDIDNADEMERAASDIGNCRASASGYYRDLADDPYTTVLGIRREGEDEWIGMLRAYHMETPDGEDVFALDNLGIQYEGDFAGAPKDSCDFENYGDALPVMGLAGIAYGLENDFDYVVAGRNDGRVGGGPGETIGVAQLYSTKNTDEDELPLRKKGRRGIDRPFGFRDLEDDRSTQRMALLLENPGRYG